jgi:biopolymer transport protein ExbD
MQFLIRKRRQPPTIIIISLIDILIVLLIFLTVTTTFKQQPAVRIALPESTQAKPGATEANLIVTIAKEEPHIYFGPQSVTLDRLQTELASAAAKNPGVNLSIRTDTDAPFGEFVKVWDAAKAAKIQSIQAFTKSELEPN